RLPASPKSSSEIYKDLDGILLHSMNPTHPGYLGHMDSIPTAASVLGDVAASLLNNNMLSLEMSPVLSRLEQALTWEFAQRFGLGEKGGGLLTSGGTLA